MSSPSNFSNTIPFWINSHDSYNQDRGPPDTDHNNAFDLHSKIMLTAIISLSLVVLLVFALHLYARFILRCQSRRRAFVRELQFTVAAQPNDPQKMGLDPLVIASLPSFVFKQSEGDHDQSHTSSTSIDCAVCLSLLENEEMVRLLPNCKHTFHVECIDMWLSTRSTCPICRTEAKPRVQPVTREGPVGGIGLSSPSLELVDSTLTSDGGRQPSSSKVNGSSSCSRFDSFKRMLSRERSFNRIQSCGQHDGIEDLERQ